MEENNKQSCDANLNDSGVLDRFTKMSFLFIVHHYLNHLLPAWYVKEVQLISLVDVLVS